MKQFYLIILFLLGAAALPAQSQCHPTGLADFETDGVKARFFNGSDFAWDLRSQPAYEVPKGSGKHALFTGGVWMGAYDASGQLHFANSSYRQLGLDHFSGPVRTTGQYSDCEGGFYLDFPMGWQGPYAHASGMIFAVCSTGVLRYDPLTDVTTTHQFSTMISKPSTIELSNGKILVVEGNGSTPVTTCYLFDLGTMQVVQVDTAAHNHAAPRLVNLANGELLIYGLSGVEVYDPVAGTFTIKAPMAIPNKIGTGILLPDGRVFVAGSHNVVGTNQTQLYDPGTNTWTIGPTMSVFRNSPSLVLLPSGKVLLAGGDPSIVLEEYTPQAGTIAQVYSLNAISLQDAELLPSGEVLFSVAVGDPQFDGNPYHPFVYDPLNPSARMLYSLSGPGLVQSTAGDVFYEWHDGEYRRLDLSLGKPEDQRWQRIWSLSKAQIDQFRQDHQNQTVNFGNYPDIETWPGNGTLALGEEARLAPFVDVNQDGLYKPAQDGDYPCILGDQALWWVYNDDGIHTESGGLPLGIQVEAMTYAFDCDLTPCPDSNLRYAIFQHLEITNRSTNSYSDFVVGEMFDSDIGAPFNDFVGSDTILRMAFTYNGEANDPGPSGYGSQPPAFGAMMLPNAHMDGAHSFISYDSPPVSNFYPQTPEEFYQYLLGSWPDSSSLVNNGLDGYPGTAPGPVTHWMFSGDPGFCGRPPSGWSEISAGRQPNDRRMVLSSEPITLAPNAIQEVDLVYLFGQGTDYLSSVCTLKTTATNLLGWWPTVDRSCISSATGKPEHASAAPHTLPFFLFPNPADRNMQIAWETTPTQSWSYALHDMTGRILRQAQVRAGIKTHAADLDNLPAGMYVVTVTSGGRVSTQRLNIAH